MIDEKKLIEALKHRMALHEQDAAEIDSCAIECGGEELLLRLADEVQAVIEVIEAQPKVKCSDCSRRSWYQKGYQDGLNINKWIPCSERLPEEDGTYIAWITYEGSEYTSMEEFDTVTMWDFHAFNPNNKVIAWKPLPEDYKGE